MLASVANQPWSVPGKPGLTRLSRWIGAALLLLLALAAALSLLSTMLRTHDWPVSATLARLAIGAAVSLLVAGVALGAIGQAAARRLVVSPRVTALACLLCVTVAALIGWLAFDGFASSADEYGFLFGAETMQRGRLVNPIPPDPALVKQAYLIARDGHWVTQYLPGWPAILALFTAMRLPTWLAAPACALAMLALLGRATSRVSSRRDVAGLATIACAASPFVLLNAATLFSHCASALFALGAILGQLDRARWRGSRWRGWWGDVLSGACLGLLLLCRIDSFLVAGVAIACAWVARPERARSLAGLVAGIAPFALGFALYNLAVTGSPITPPTVWGGNLSLGADGLRGVESHGGGWRAFEQTAWRLADLADTTTLVVPALYLWSLARATRRQSLAFYDLVPPTVFALFLVFPDYGGWQMGPRYWFDGFVVMHITVAREIAAAADPARLRGAALLACLLPAEFGLLVGQVDFHARIIAEREAPSRLAAALPDRAAFVLVGDFPSGFDRRFNRRDKHRAQDFMRNGPTADGRVLFVRADAPDALARACRLRPDAQGYRFVLGPTEPKGRLDRVSCPP